MDVALVATGALVIVYALVLRAIWIPRGVTDLGWGTLALQAGLVGASGVFCTWRGYWGLGLLLGLAFVMIGWLTAVKAADLLRGKWRSPLPTPEPVVLPPDVGQIARERFHEALLQQPYERMTGPVDPVEAERARSDRMARLFG